MCELGFCGFAAGGPGAAGFAGGGDVDSAEVLGRAEGGVAGQVGLSVIVEAGGEGCRRVLRIEAVAEAIRRVKSERCCGVSRMEVRDWSSEEGEGERWWSPEDQGR